MAMIAITTSSSIKVKPCPVEQVLLPVLAARPVEQAVLLHGAGRHWEAGVFSDLPRVIPVPIPPGERCELFIKSKAEIEKAEMGFHFAIWLIVCSFIISAFYFLLSAFSKGGWASSKFQSHSKQVSCQSAKENLDS
jgi:hypothetical protein